GEAAAHELPELRVPGRVHVDHRTEELEHLDRQVADVRALTRAERLRVARCAHDVLVADERPEARPFRHARELALLVEADRPLRAGLRKQALAVRAGPRLELAQLDIVDRQVRRGEWRHRPTTNRATPARST